MERKDFSPFLDCLEGFESKFAFLQNESKAGGMPVLPPYHLTKIFKLCKMRVCELKVILLNHHARKCFEKLFYGKLSVMYDLYI